MKIDVGIITFILVLLKLTHVISCSWWVVMSPIIFFVVIFVLAFVFAAFTIIYIQGKNVIAHR